MLHGRADPPLPRRDALLAAGRGTRVPSRAALAPRCVPQQAAPARLPGPRRLRVSGERPRQQAPGRSRGSLQAMARYASEKRRNVTLRTCGGAEPEGAARAMGVRGEGAVSAEIGRARACREPGPCDPGGRGGPCGPNHQGRAGDYCRMRCGAGVAGTHGRTAPGRGMPGRPGRRGAHRHAAAPGASARRAAESPRAAESRGGRGDHGGPRTRSPVEGRGEPARRRRAAHPSGACRGRACRTPGRVAGLRAGRTR